MSIVTRLGSIWTSVRETFVRIAGAPDSGSAYVKINGSKKDSTGSYSAMYGDRILVYTSFDGGPSEVQDSQIDIREKQLNGTWITVAPNTYDGYSVYAQYEFEMQRKIKVSFSRRTYYYDGKPYYCYRADIEPI